MCGRGLFPFLGQPRPIQLSHMYLRIGVCCVCMGAVLVSSLNVIGKVAANLLILLHVTVTFLRLFSFNNLWRTMVLLPIIKWWGCAEALRGSKGNSPETPFLPS